jgi:hypothetical protein
LIGGTWNRTGVPAAPIEEAPWPRCLLLLLLLLLLLHLLRLLLLLLLLLLPSVTPR